MRRTPWLLLSLAPLIGGCSDDPCELLCQNLGQRLGGCLEEWETDWEFFGATRQRSYVTNCQDTWNETRVDLEVRQIDVAKDACQDGIDELRGLSCTEIRALYF